MPYNLRKRKAPEAPSEEVKKPRVKKERSKKEQKKEVSSEEKLPTDEALAVEVPLEKPPKKQRKDEPQKKLTTEVSQRKLPKEEPPKKLSTEESRRKLPKEEPPKKRQKESNKAEHKADEAHLESKEEEKAKDECNLYIFGADSCGELGLQKIGFSKKAPTLVPIGHRVKQVACGPIHTVVLTTEGEVYTFGCNDEGALGRVTNDEEEEATPTLIQLGHKICKISAGDSHSVALTENNKVFIWGNFRDEHGSVGLLPECDGEKTYEPIEVMPETKFKDIASGSNHILLLDVEGSVYSFGVGQQGQLGRLIRETMDGTGSVKSEGVTKENRLIYLRPENVSLKHVDSKRPFVCDAIYAGNYSSFATNTDKKKNRLASWGLNNYHQLGYKPPTDHTVQYVPRRTPFPCSTSIIQVACGQHHTLFLTKSGRVYAAGRNNYGMLGLGDVKTEAVCPPAYLSKFNDPIVTMAAGINTSFALTNKGALYSWGMNGQSLGVEGEEDLKNPTQIKRLAEKKVIAVSTGGDFTAVLTE